MGRIGSVRVLEEDPELARGLKPGELEQALRRSLVPAVEVEVGDWFPPKDAPDEVMGVLVLEGLIARWLDYAGQTVADLLGRGDLILPFASVTSELDYVPSRVSWQVLEPARLAALDRPFHDAMLEHPRVFFNLLDRISRQELAMTQRLAMMEAPLPERLFFVLWQLARRHGRVDADGAVLPFELSEDLLAGLAAADVPEIGPALKKLAGCERIAKHTVGWRLLRDWTLAD